MSPEWLTALTALAVAVTGCAGWLTKKSWHVLRRVGHFLDDYQGQPAREGMAARPGLLARLSSVEEIAGKVLAETTTNHGQSLRDVVQRTAEDVAEIKSEQAEMRRRMELFEARRNGGSA